MIAQGGGLYAQDEWRTAGNVTLSLGPGLRAHQSADSAQDRLNGFVPGVQSVYVRMRRAGCCSW